ncbi:MAG TPA: hypothetical protein VFH03_17865 [Actinoplanes sp.]|nr:hypothetical protein [Actinoplanes sp.]
MDELTRAPDGPERAGPRKTRPASQVARHLSDNVSAVLYGAVLAAAAMAIVGAQPAKTRYVSVSVLLMLVVYSLAHLYTQVLGARMSQPDVPMWRRIGTGALYEAAVLEGGLAVLLCFGLLRLLGIGAVAAAQVASWFAVVLLAFIGYRIGRLRGATGGRLALEIAGAAGIGLLTIALKVLLS